MCNDSFCDLFVFWIINFKWMWNFMYLNFASRLSHSGWVHDRSDRHFSIAAAEWISVAIHAWFCFRILFVNMTVSHLGYMIENVTSVTLKDVKVRPNFPINLSPRNTIGFSHKSHKLLKVPISINNMFCSYLTISIDIAVSLTAVENFPLAHRKQFIAVSALIQIVPFFL